MEIEMYLRIQQIGLRADKTHLKGELLILSSSKEKSRLEQRGKQERDGKYIKECQRHMRHNKKFNIFVAGIPV